ncbi:hypothetical protein [Corynebacterium macginleyi]|uniref:hypothetical protein n=1 Tax=Corynebacterium macginleyi TaxID=38290 RepID=UPI00190DB63D|nr:hypothetical protein [Corynebacterium macginleyi]MBK4138440.1 hypothetical protein [Corynebacterium macginleyi]MBM0262416.1 hypothetical protein [Corynebacterium macginleyi]
MVTESLEVRSGGLGLRALLARAVGVDANASVRLRQLADDVVDAFVTTPFEVVASRRVQGFASRDGAVVSAQRLEQQLAAGNGTGLMELGPSRDASWPGALPPAHGFSVVDILPVAVVRELSDQGQKLTREFSGHMGPPPSLLNQTVVTVEGNGQAVEIPMRMIFACTNLGLIPGFSASMDIPRHLRVSSLGRWVRLDAPFGSIYRSTRLSVL